MPERHVDGNGREWVPLDAYVQAVGLLHAKRLGMLPDEPGAQRQDSLDDQLRDVRRVATAMGCYDAADWIRGRTLA